MSKRLLLAAAAALAALWAGPAGAFSLCPDDKTGEYTPDACDLIWPFEPNPDRVECDIVADLEAGEAHPVCLDYYRKYWGLDETTLARLLAAETPATDEEICRAAWERLEAIRLSVGLRPGGELPEDHGYTRDSCELNLTVPEAKIREFLLESIEICGGDCRDLVRKKPQP